MSHYEIVTAAYAKCDLDVHRECNTRDKNGVRLRTPKLRLSI